MLKPSTTKIQTFIPQNEVEMNLKIIADKLKIPNFVQSKYLRGAQANTEQEMMEIVNYLVMLKSKIEVNDAVYLYQEQGCKIISVLPTKG